MNYNVNKVLVGNLVGTSVASLAKGQIMVVNELGAIPTAQGKFRVVLCKGTLTTVDGTTVADTVYSDWIEPIRVNNFVALTGAADPFTEAQDSIEIDLTGLKGSGAAGAIVKGDRFVLRVLYKNLNEIVAGQFTRSVEYIAKDGDTGVEVADALEIEINKTQGMWLTVANDAAGILTILAKPIVRDSLQYDAMNLYSRRNIEASVYFTNEKESILFNNWYQDASAVITKTAGRDGTGNPQVVRDRENYALGYKGIKNRRHFPVLIPELMTDFVNAPLYNYITLDYQNLYQSNDNQYVKNTGLTLEIYAPQAIITSLATTIATALGTNVDLGDTLPAA